MVGLFGMTAASTGASERTLKRVGTPYEKVGGSCCVMPTEDRLCCVIPMRRRAVLVMPMRKCLCVSAWLRRRKLTATACCASVWTHRRCGLQASPALPIYPRNPATNCAASTPFQIYVHAANHAGYYPGAAPISLKLLFSPSDGRVLGCQATGTVEGVEKRVDVIATIMQARAAHW